MEILKALLIGAGIYATLVWSDRAPTALEMALLAALWAAAVGLVFWRIGRRRRQSPRATLGQVQRRKATDVDGDP